MIDVTGNIIANCWEVGYPLWGRTEETKANGRDRLCAPTSGWSTAPHHRAGTSRRRAGTSPAFKGRFFGAMSGEAAWEAAGCNVPADALPAAWEADPSKKPPPERGRVGGLVPARAWDRASTGRCNEGAEIELRTS